MNDKPLVQVSQDELPPLREAMRDIQEAVAAYYAETARDEDLGAPVRTFLVKAQTLNDRFTNAVGDTATYRGLFVSPTHASADLISAVRYARNVDQHILHIVRPRPDTLVGGQLGMRVYAFWEEVPVDVHAKLRPSTQKLKPAYDTTLQGKEVTGTMLAVLRFYAEIAPEIVHRDHRGEWTGFPLMSQPGVATPLHPDEPTDVIAARSWLDGRLPICDARVVCGQLSIDDSSYVVGLTFARRLSFAPFVETIDQVNRDIDAGFPYLLGDVAKNVEDVSGQFPLARQGGVLHSRGEVNSWASPITQASKDEDWCTYLDAEIWRRMVKMEHPGVFPEGTAYEVRRARRLNAVVPPSA